ncbi:unnamed protein product [Rotaria sp. Silwood1]|nr:unnamed protein product [Rotaria sp. Silwood1]
MWDEQKPFHQDKSDTNPHRIIEQELNVPRVTIWGGIWSNGVVGSYFFEDNVTSQNYQQGGAPPHYGQVVRYLLDDTCLNWIDRRGTIGWPPHSPDLIPCDFSLWEIVKDHVYAQNSRDINHTKPLIKEEFTLLNSNIELCQERQLQAFY